MDRAINNLTVPLGQLREEIMVRTPSSCIEMPLCGPLLGTRLSMLFMQVGVRLAFMIVVMHGVDYCVHVVIILIPTEYQVGHGSCYRCY